MLSQRERGYFTTPEWLVSFMLSLARVGGGPLKVLEPACGDCVFLRAARKL